MSSDNTSNTPNDAIDADFEPAPAADYVLPEAKAARSGPGWLPLGVVGALSVGALGLSAASLNQGSVDGGAFAPASISDDLSTLIENQASNKDEIKALRQSAEASEKRMAAQIEALLSGDDESEGLQALVTELEAVSERLDEASVSGAGSEAIEALEERLAVLEEADDGEAVSPRQMNRAVTALRARVKALETQNEELADQLETRAEALAALTSRLNDVEFAVQDVESAGGSATPDLLANLQEEMAQLKTTVERTEDIDIENDQRFSEMLKTLQSAEEADGKVDAAETTASAALALSRIEAAAREGNSFHVAYKKLAEALPGDASVKALAPIAKSGAPTLQTLRTRFEGDRGAALEAADLQAEDGWGWTRQVFGSGVTVRRAAEAGGPRDLLDQASKALEAGDLEPAIEAVENLPDDSKTIMQDWLASASARVTLESSLEEISVKLIGRDR